MKKILFPTDFSKTSLNAFSYALHFASKINAEIITLHVYSLPSVTTMENYDFLLQTYDLTELSEFENYKNEVPKLKKIAKKLNLEHVPMSHVLQQGDAKIEILNAARHEKPDFIIIGTKGASGLKEVFLGTIAEKVINQSKVPVLAIPEDAKFKGIKKILYIAELENLEIDKLAKVCRIATLFNADIQTLQVRPHKDEEEDLLLNEWKKHFENDPVRFTILHSNAAEDIVTEYIETCHIDLTVMLIHHKDFWQRLFLYSLSRNMAYHTTVPLLSLPSI